MVNWICPQFIQLSGFLFLFLKIPVGFNYWGKLTWRVRAEEIDLAVMAGTGTKHRRIKTATSARQARNLQQAAMVSQLIKRLISSQRSHDLQDPSRCSSLSRKEIQLRRQTNLL